MVLQNHDRRVEGRGRSSGPRETAWDWDRLECFPLPYQLALADKKRSIIIGALCMAHNSRNLPKK